VSTNEAIFWHALYIEETEHGRRVFQDYFFASPNLLDAEKELQKRHPKAIDWHIATSSTTTKGDSNA